MKIESVKLKDIRVSFLNKKISINKGNYNWSNLKNSIIDNGFLYEKYGYISISKNNFILDGHHRYLVLKELYGENYEIKVIKKRINYGPLITCFLTVALIFLFINLIYKILRKKPPFVFK